LRIKPSHGIFDLSKLAGNYDTLIKNWLHPEWTGIYEGLLKKIIQKIGWRYFDNDTEKWYVADPLTRSNKWLVILFIEEGKNKYRFLQFFYSDGHIVNAKKTGRYKNI